jgi:histidinol-phosphate aminotransferase
MTEAARRPRPKTGILDIAAYVGGKSAVEGFAEPIKLSSNENVLGCSPLAQAAYEATATKLHLYPDGHCNDLRAAIVQKFGLEPERLIFTAGSDEIFDMLAQTYLEPGDNAVQGEYGFLSYRIAVRANQGIIRFAPEPNRRVDVDLILAEVDERTRIVFIANPGNPTGSWLNRPEIERLHAALPSDVILVLDGAYAEFADDPDYTDGMDLARTASNIVVTRTFSKIHGLAALRVGWAYCPAEMVDAMDRIRSPFNVNAPAQAAALEALKDDAFVEQSKAHVNQWRAWLAQQLGGLGLETFPSAANFLLVRFPDSPGKTAKEAEAALAAKGILVRGVGGYGLPDSLRITIGLEDQNRAVVDALSAFLKG